MRPIKMSHGRVATSANHLLIVVMKDELGEHVCSQKTLYAFHSHASEILMSISMFEGNLRNQH